MTAPSREVATGGGDLVERGERLVDGLGPEREVGRLGRRALLLRRVVAVVAGEIEVGQMDQGVLAVQFQLAELGAQRLLEHL
ncbi:hypothetical protein GCM10020001_057940 [Nonomuraea salmonea]